MNSHAIQIVLQNSDPNGIKIINMAGWDGECFIIPRTELRSVEGDHVQKSGLYFLFGEDEVIGDQQVYIGESRDCLSRILRHDSEKDFWNQAIIFLNPPDRKYLESQFVSGAKEAGRYIIKNGATPHPEDMKAYEMVANSKYSEGVRIILSTFGYEVLEKISESYSDNKLYFLKGEATDAKARILDNNQIIVLEGSLARKRETEAFTGWAYVARQKYLRDGKLKQSDHDLDSYVFTEDVVFKTPSAAAATIKGAPVNGWTAWKDSQGVTLDENIRK